MNDCIFCKIINNELPSVRIYEDNNFLAIMDLFPTAKGHSLLIPKMHHRNIFDAPHEIAEKVYPILSKICKATTKGLNCDGINIIQNNEAAAGQIVFHSHIHIIPRFVKDTLPLGIAGKEKASNEELVKIAQDIISYI